MSPRGKAHDHKAFRKGDSVMNKRTLVTACAFMFVSLVVSGVARSQPAAPPDVVGTYLLTILE